MSKSAKIRNVVIKRGDLVGNNIPDNIIINAEVAMNQAVTHPSDGAPLNRWIFLPQGVGYLFDCFADDFNTANIRPFLRLVLQERCLVKTTGTLEQIRRFIEDMLEILTH